MTFASFFSTLKVKLNSNLVITQVIITIWISKTLIQVCFIPSCMTSLTIFIPFSLGIMTKLRNLVCRLKSLKLKENITNITDSFVHYIMSSAEAAQEPGRPMKYPYTMSAKIAQFPYRHYFSNQWIWKYWAISCVVCFPIFYKIHGLGMYYIF